jgi:hypothetical protein
MSTLLLRRSPQIVFALLCVLVLTRMPLVCFVDEISWVSDKIQDGVAVAAQCTVYVVEVTRPLLPSGVAHHIHADPRQMRRNEYSIMRL